MQIAQCIWSHTHITQQSPLVICSTSGPIHSLRQLLELHRPQQLAPAISFLPKILSVTDWLSQTKSLLSFPAVQTTLQRWEMVYGQLDQYGKIQHQFGVMGTAGRWALAKAIVQACDFLTQSNIAFAFQGTDQAQLYYAKAQAEFEQTLNKAYPRLNFGLAQEEGQLILAFWQFLSSTEDPLVRERMAYQYRQQELVAGVSPPLVWMEMATPVKTLQSAQTEFLQSYAQHQDVLSISLDWQNSALWPECITGKVFPASPAIKEQVAKNRLSQGHHQWRIIAQPNFERLAWAALMAVLGHFNAGRTQVAMIAQDRLVSRRVRALLARYGEKIAIHDQTGWRLSTTSAAAAVHSYFAVLDQESGPSLSKLFGFFKNPMLDWSWTISQFGYTILDPQEFSGWLEARLLANPMGMGWSHLHIFFAQEESTRDSHAMHATYCAIARALFAQLDVFSQSWQLAKQTSKAWTDLLETQLQTFGMLDALQADAAGVVVLDVFEQLKTLTNQSLRFRAWTSLFDQWVEQAAYIPQASKKDLQLSLIPLSAIRFSHYDAVVMVGCDDRQLPSTKDYGSVFSRAMIQALDEDLPEAEYVQQARDLSYLLSAHHHVDLLWQEYHQAEEKNRLCAWLARLHMDLPHMRVDTFELPLGKIQHQVQYPTQARVLKRQLLPDKVSPSAYQAFRSCPYRFYVANILGLRSPRALRETSEFGQIGSVLHAILYQFYKTYEQQTAFPDTTTQGQWMAQKLHEISRLQWAPMIAHNGQCIADLQQWYAQIPLLVAWQLAQEEQGWRFVDAEKNVEFHLLLNSGDNIKIAGRVDRVDQNNNQDLRVIDYKYKSGSDLKQFLKSLWEDPQILIYSQALTSQNRQRQRSVQEAAWVSLRDARADQRSLQTPVDDQVLQRLEQQMLVDLNGVWDGAALPANGAHQVCRYCDVRGLCRKGMWEA